MNLCVWLARMPMKATGFAVGVSRARPWTAPSSWLEQQRLVVCSTLEWSVVQMQIYICFLWADMYEEWGYDDIALLQIYLCFLWADMYGEWGYDDTALLQIYLCFLWISSCAPPRTNNQWWPLVGLWQLQLNYSMTLEEEKINHGFGGNNLWRMIWFVESAIFYNSVKIAFDLVQWARGNKDYPNACGESLPFKFDNFPCVWQYTWIGLISFTLLIMDLYLSIINIDTFRHKINTSKDGGRN